MREKAQPPVVMAVTGASGAIYALRTAKALLEAGGRIELVQSAMGAHVLAQELDGAGGGFTPSLEEVLGRSVEPGEVIEYDPMNLAAPPSSGSHATAGMVIVPCSMKTLAAVAGGHSRTLIERAADVSLKERRPLILVPRECPLSLVHLRSMTAATEAGAIVAPAAPAFYQGPQSFDDLADFIAGRILSLLGIEHSLFTPWGEEDR